MTKHPIAIEQLMKNFHASLSEKDKRRFGELVMPLFDGQRSELRELYTDVVAPVA